MERRGVIIHLDSRENRKVEKAAKFSLGGGMVSGRKQLSDISNVNWQEKVPNSMEELENPVPVPNSMEYAQLLKENTALLRLLRERNQIIEYSKLEVQKLRLAFQKAQQQNWQLAQAHSQMLAELNMGKDRLKVLQHEHACTVAMLKVKDSKAEGKGKMDNKLADKISKEENQSMNSTEVAGDECQLPCNKKPGPPNRKRASRNHIISAGLGSATHQVVGKENDDNKRRSTRRRSNSFKPEICEPNLPVSSGGDPMIEDHLIQLGSSAFSTSNGIANEEEEHEGTKAPISKLEKEEQQGNGNRSVAFSTSNAISCEANEQIHEGIKASISKGAKEEKQGNEHGSQCQNQGVSRSSIGRPLRRATIGVSYKERSLQTKLRRSS